MICFAWYGYPQYAARCVGALTKEVNEEVVVVATRPAVPIEGMERLSNCRVIWVDENDSRTIEQVLGAIPSTLFLSGWMCRAFNRYRDQVRTAGGTAIAMCDNNFWFSLKEVVKAIRFRLFLRNKYDGFFVPGKSGVKLLRFYGVPKHKIQIGQYIADASLFNDGGVNICKRPKRIIFVGRLCETKNPLRLCAAFKSSGAAKQGWMLDLYGCGPLKDRIPQGEGITVHNFTQPEELAAKYRQSRIFCLPSLSEHWGLVVHEATLSGCVLLLSEEIGAKDDFKGEHNCFTFPANNEQALAKALRRIMSLTDEELQKASAESVMLGKTHSFSTFIIGVKRLMTIK